MLMWLRHKLFGTEFVWIEHGIVCQKRKVHFSLKNFPYIVTSLGQIIAISFEDRCINNDFTKWIWLYKNKEKAK